MKARTEFVIQRLQEKSQQTQEETIEMVFVRAIIEERLKEKIILEKKAADEGFEKLNSRIENMEQTQKETFQILNTKSDKLEEKQDKSEKEILELKLANIYLQAQTTSLHYEIQRRQQEIAELNQRVNKGRRLCVIQ